MTDEIISITLPAFYASRFVGRENSSKMLDERGITMVGTILDGCTFCGSKASLEELGLIGLYKEYILLQASLNEGDMDRA